MLWLVFAGLAFLMIGFAAYSLNKSANPSQRRAGNRRRTVLFASGTVALLLLGAAVAIWAGVAPLRLPGQAAQGSASGSADAMEQQLKARPTAAGYKQLASLYFTAGHYDRAVAAGHRAIELGATDSGTWSEFGESIVMASGGQVAPQALAAFANAVSADPKDARARYYIGMAEAQIGDLKQAVAIWRDLEKDGDPKATWLPMVRQHIEAFSKQGGFEPDSVPPAAPDPDALRSAVAAMRGAMAQRPEQTSTAR